MTSIAVGQARGERYDVRTVVGGGVVLGVATAAGVALFALVSRASTGTAELVIQSALVLAGGVVFSFAPAVWVRPRSVDGIAWAALVGLLGALAFTVLDAGVLRPLEIYHWTWDEIGGGSGFWYIPVWWMGSAVLAWLGAWSARLNEGGGFARLAAMTTGVGLALFAVLALTGVAPATPAVVALGFVLGHVVQIGLASARGRR